MSIKLDSKNVIKHHAASEFQRRGRKVSLLFRILFRNFRNATFIVKLTGACALTVSVILPGVTAKAESPIAANQNSVAPAVDSPAARRWEFGPFVQGGSGVGERDDFQFFAAGFQAGRTLTPILHAGPLTGRFEFGVNIMPLWQAYTPAAHNEVVSTGGVPFNARIGGGTYTGVSVTPVIFRWNLMPNSRRFMPWVQAAGGAIYTTHKFPGTIEVPKGSPGGTSVFNFSPQGGAGVHYFFRPRRSIDFALNAEHISSASLGDRNPGVNASLQLQVGYTWWK